MNTLRITRWIEVVAFSRKPTVVLCNHRNKHSKFFFYVFFSSEGLLVEWRLLVPQTTKQALFFQNPPFFRPQRWQQTLSRKETAYITRHLLHCLGTTFHDWPSTHTFVFFFFFLNIEWDLGWMPRPLCPVWGGHYSHRGGGEIERSGCHDGNGMALQEASAWPGAKLSATSFSNSKPLHHL